MWVVWRGWYRTALENLTPLLLVRKIRKPTNPTSIARPIPKPMAAGTESKIPSCPGKGLSEDVGADADAESPGKDEAPVLVVEVRVGLATTLPLEIGKIEEVSVGRVVKTYVI